MNQNYYDILEVNKNASPEVIEKAYKTLVKKYHPDLQDDNLKANYEEKIKLINEAYEVLSNPEKRNSYDLNLKNNEISENDYNNLINENMNLQNEINYLRNNQVNQNNQYNPNQYTSNQYNTNQTSNQNDNINNTAEYITNVLNQKINNAVNQAYQDAYIRDLKNRGYRIRYKKTFKDFLALILTILFLLILGFILWHIPFVKNYVLDVYNSNEMLKNIINILFNK